MQTIGERIAELLKEQGERRKDLAKHLGVTDNTISYHVRGTRTPTIPQIICIADYFNVSTDYLLGRTDVKTTDTTVKGICEYTGLSEETVKAMHKNPHTFVGNIASNITKYVGRYFNVQGKDDKK